MKTIGFVNGCFDVLHVGHIRMLCFAKNQCDVLIVGIDGDERVRKMKGNSRPINNEADRSEFLLSITSVDKVSVFNNEAELIDLINSINPDIMVVGSDYQNKRVIGAKHAKKLVFFDRIAGYSTSKIVESSSDR